MDTLIRLFIICVGIVLVATYWAESNPPKPAKQEPPVQTRTVDVEKIFDTKLEDYKP